MSRGTSADSGRHGAWEARSRVGPFGLLPDAAAEAARVDAARRVVAAQPEVLGLNRLTALAARVLGAESSQVSIIDDEQTVVAGVGEAEPSVGGRSSGLDSLCTIPMQAGSSVAIADARTDVRSRALLPVTSGAVSSYLGAPLRVDGHLVGALCVFDSRRRAWSGEDAAVLTQLAQSVAVEIEFGLMSSAYEQDRVRWQLAVEAAGVGAFDWDLETGELRWDGQLLELFGLSRETFGGTIEAFNESVHPDDREAVGRALSRAIESCGTYEAEYRINRPDGSVRWISARGRALAGPDGRAARVLGAAYDTTAAQDGEASVRRVLEAMPSAFFHLDRDWRFSYLNAHAARMLGVIGRELAGGVIWELFPDTVGSEFERYYRHALESGEPVQFEAYYPVPLDCWYEVRARPSPEGLAVYFLDVTDRHNAQELTELARQRGELLSNLSDALTGTLDREEAAAALAETVVGPLADWCVVSLIDHPTVTSPVAPGAASPADWRRGLRDVAGWHLVPGLREHVQQYVEHRLEALTDTSFVARAVNRQERTVIARRATAEIATVLAPGPARDALTELGPGSAVIAPLRARGRTLGLLSVFRDVARGGFSPAELQLLTEVTDRAGLSFDNARLYDEQVELAEGLQRILLTDPPDSPYLEIAACYSPAAEQAQVGGDWYDAFVLADGATCVVIGDVAGHDTRAAADMGQLRGLLRGVAVTTDAGPAETLQRVDAAMETLRLDTTATAVVARVDPPQPDGAVRLVWSNAGHPPLVVVRSTEHAGGGPRTELLGTAAHLLLGLEPTSERDEGTVTLREGDVVLFCTDGLIERRGASIDDGLDLLVQTLPRLLDEGGSLESVCARLVGELVPAAPEDDAALIAVRVRLS